jgi:hypothetical protein
MDKRTKKQVISKLQTMLDTKKYPSGGICEFLKCELHIDYTFVRECAKSWKGYSGNPVYPVKSFNKKYDEDAYFWKVDNHWYGKYGTARKDLCKHIIKRLRKKLYGT